MSVHKSMLALAVIAGSACLLPAEQPSTAEQLARLHQLIKPQPGESHWLQISWLTSVWEARKQAAAQGKPIFIWAGSGGGPVGIC